MAEFSWNWLINTTFKFRKRKKNRSTGFYVFHKTAHQENSRRSRDGKEVDQIAWCTREKTVTFIPKIYCCFNVLVANPAAYLKLPIKRGLCRRSWRQCCYTCWRDRGHSFEWLIVQKTYRVKTKMNRTFTNWTPSWSLDRVYWVIINVCKTSGLF